MDNITGEFKSKIKDATYFIPHELGIRPPLSFSFEITMTRRENETRIFDCQVDNIVGMPDHGTKLLTAISFDTVQERNQYLTNVETKQGHFKGVILFSAGEVHFALGNHVGIPLTSWIEEQHHSDVWSTINTGKTLWASARVASVGRALGALYNTYHESDKCVGVIEQHLFFNPETNEITIICLDDIPQALEDGIRSDLEVFCSFVNALGRTIPEGREADAITWNYFNELSKGPLPSNLEGWKSRSYFLIHSPIFWNLQLRIHFVGTWGDLTTESDLVSKVQLNGMTNWQNKIQSLDKNSVIRKMFVPLRYKASWDIVKFERNVITHFSKKDSLILTSEIDEKFLELFPDMLSLAYMELYKLYLPTHPGLIKLLKGIPFPINYKLST